MVALAGRHTAKVPQLMALAYQKVSLRDLARGIDARSVQNAIQEGYSEDLVNCDTNSNGHLSKRHGYQGYYGYLPIRVSQIEHVGTSIIFTVDGSVNTSGLDKSPIVVYGHLSSAQSGDWTTTDASHYYIVTAAEFRHGLTAPSGTTTVQQNTHGVETDNVFMTILESTASGNNSSSMMFVDQLDINDVAPHDVDITYTVPSNVNIFLSISDRDTVGGSSYNQTDTIATGTTVVTIPAGTHNLDNFNIISQHYQLVGAEWVQIIPDLVTVSGTGQVSISITNAGASADFKTVLAAAPLANTALTVVPGASSSTLTVSMVDFDFYHMSVYRDNAGSLEQVIPDTVVRDSDAETLAISLTNSAPGAQTFRIFFEEAAIQTSTLTVTDTTATSTTYTDADPQLTIWGLNHDGAYVDSASQGGHVTHIDSYRREAEQRLIAGLGGVLHAARTRAEAGTAYLIPSSAVSVQNRVDTAAVLGPAFITTGGDTTRSRGTVAADDVVENHALITGVTISAPGVAVYQLSLTNKVGDLSTALGVSSTTPDYLVVTGMANSINNGTFVITAISNASNTITVAATATLSDFDETGARGRAGVFTDQVELEDPSEFLPDDSIGSGLSIDIPVVTSSGTILVLGDLTSNQSMPEGLALYAARTSPVLPLAATTNFVTGDMCTVSGVSREIRVISINTLGDVTVSSITVSSGVATVTLASDHRLKVGHRALLLRTGVAAFDGAHTVTDVPADNMFSFTTTSTAAASAGVMKGATVAIDESLSFADDGAAPTTMSVTGRWIPIEAPTSEDNLPDTTRFNYFDANAYDEQPILRSTMVTDSLFVTNNEDEIHKFDGTSLYQAGLFRWQPQLFAQVDLTTTSIPVRSTQTTAVSPFWTANKFVVTLGGAVGFSIGDRISNSEDNAIYTIVAKGDDGTNDFIYVDRDITGSASGETLRLVSRYRYYFRLNAIDANQNLIASAATGADDFLIDLPASGQIHLRLVGLPTWGNLDYDRLEVQVYRTAANTQAPFFLIRTADMSFAAGDGYLDIQDGTSDDNLADFDAVNTALLGAELGTGWTNPLRAQHITTTNNRLVLANLRDYPELDITVRKKATAAAVAAADLAGRRWLFRRDSTDAATTTSMNARAAYEFRTSGAVTIAPASDIATSSTTFTVTETAHGLVAGNWVYIFHAAAGTDNHLNFAGWWQIFSATANDFTIKFNNTITPTVDDCDRYVTATTPTDIPVWLGTDGNRNQVNANVVNEFTSMLRLAEAINASMRMTDTTLATFTPWMTAGAGSEFGVGRMVVRQEKVEPTTLEMVVPAAITTADVFVQGVRKTAADQVSASTRVMPSRLIISYSNFPEIFDSPNGLQTDSDSVVDVNSADGQEITGIIPFFGDAVFGTGIVEAVLVVFKTNSIYLLDVNTRQLNKIESRGLGCTAPRSIASTRDGVMFANDSGIYRLNRDQTISYVGRHVERLWEDNVNHTNLTQATGHHYGVGRKYKLSVPVGEDQTTNNHVYAYDHEREGRDQEFGAWTRYTNHSATGWANLGNEAFFATTTGQIYKIRTAGDETDYRDDAAAVADMEILLRPEDFGMAGVRKVISGVVSHFQLRRSDMDGTTLFIGPDLDGSFANAGQFTLTKTPTIKVGNVSSSPPSRRMEFIQLRYTNSTIDEDVVLSGVDFRVAGLDEFGIPERAETE